MTATATSTGTAGLRVLVVEDMFLVADMIADILAGSGVQVIGPVGRLAPALALARQEVLDGVLLDVNLAGESSAPIAQVLRERGIPFIFLTGYSDAGVLPPEFREAPRVTKPFGESELAAEIAARFGPHPQEPLP